MNIRNFCITAHIDHGKSTLADRILEFTNTISKRDMKEQFLDKMDLERERGITIKAKAVCINHNSKDGKNYILNLIDTPGHVDFNYEVKKSLAACEGAVLVVDASQGIEAQTLANFHLCLEQGLEIIPVINKIDLPSAEPEKVKKQIEDILGLDSTEVILASAKEGIGTEEILETVVKKVPPPKGNQDASLRALIFDSTYDTYKGVIVFVRIVDGYITKGMNISMMATGTSFEVIEVGVFKPEMTTTQKLSAGEVGYITANIRQVRDVKIGDTITEVKDVEKVIALPGYKDVKPMVFCGLHPINAEDYNMLKDALDKLKLNDSSLMFEPENSIALGFGYRCGFLGLLHMEIIQERLEREYNLNLIATAPNVVYRIHIKDKDEVPEIDNPAKFPNPAVIDYIEEPFITMSIITPSVYVGNIITLLQDRRGIYKNTEYITTERAILTYEIPLGEIILDFYDKLKSCTKGYASMDYDFLGFVESELVKVDILVAGDMVDSLSFIVHKEKAYYRSREIVKKLKEVIPKQLFEVSIQAGIGSKIIARETIPQLRKDVIAKLYGGDVTRKNKLLDKQREGKKRMKHVGRVDIPQEAFLSILKVGS
jgi:GTP-binding protein LepA